MVMKSLPNAATPPSNLRFGSEGLGHISVRIAGSEAAFRAVLVTIERLFRISRFQPCLCGTV